MNSTLLSNRLKALTDVGRLRILALVDASGELCVCEIQKVLDLTSSTASRNLRDLEQAGWLKSRREGRWIYYAASELEPDWEAMRRAAIHLFSQTPVATHDLERVRAMQAESGGRICAATPLSRLKEVKHA